MKKPLILLMVVLIALASVVMAKNVSMSSGGDPANVRVITLADNTLDSIKDTISIGGCNTYGPFGLANGFTNGMAAGFQLQYNATCLVSGDSMAVQYGLSGGTSFADTPATFTNIGDTVLTAGKRGTYVSLASQVAKSLFIRFVNIDATLIGVQKKILLMITDQQVGP